MQNTNTQDDFELLKCDEVLSAESLELSQYLDLPPTLKVAELVEAIAQQLLSQEEAHLFSKGMTCEVLKFGERNWQKGKIRVSLEFCPDEAKLLDLSEKSNETIPQPESPLDDIRRTIAD